MITSINAVNFKASDDLKNFIEEKTAKLDRIAVNATRCEVTLKVEKPESANNKIAEISVVLPGKEIFNTQQADSFEQAVSECIDATRVQIEKYKDHFTK